MKIQVTDGCRAGLRQSSDRPVACDGKSNHGGVGGLVHLNMLTESSHWVASRIFASEYVDQQFDDRLASGACVESHTMDVAWETSTVNHAN